RPSGKSWLPSRIQTLPSPRRPVAASRNSTGASPIPMETSVNRHPSSFAATAAVVALATLSLTGCDKPAAQQQGQMPPPEVNVVVVQPRDLPAAIEQVGEVAGIRQAEVRPRVTGILQRWNYDEGAPVRAGDSLFTIDPAPFRAAAARAEADVASAQARLA